MPVFAVASLVMSAVGLMQGARAARAAQDAARARAKIARFENFRTMVNVVREARVKRAEVIAAAEASGAGDTSSGVFGAEISLESQLKSNLNYLTNASLLNTQASNAEVSASAASSRAYAFQSAAGVLRNIPSDLFADIPQTATESQQTDFFTTPDMGSDFNSPSINNPSGGSLNG
jgi:hypothetical protein